MRKGKDLRLGPCQQGVEATQPGGRQWLWPEWAREVAEAMVMALAAMGRGVWEGKAPHPRKAG